MLVPKASVNEHHGLVTSQNDIGLSWQSRRVESKSKATGMQEAPNHEFGLRVAAADGRHHATSGLLIEDVSHRKGDPRDRMQRALDERAFLKMKKSP